MKKNEIKEAVRTIASRIPRFLIESDEKIQNVDDILKTKQTELFKSLIGCELEMFEECVRREYFNIKYMNRKIADFNWVLEIKPEEIKSAVAKIK